MLKRSSVENIITAALETGADFAELYAERTEQGSIGMVNGRVETAQSGLSCGAGVRLFFGTQAIYGYANDMSEKNLIQIARGCAEAMKSSVQHSRKNWRETVRPCINPIRIRKTLPNPKRRNTSGWRQRQQKHTPHPSRRPVPAFWRFPSTSLLLIPRVSGARRTECAHALR